MKKILFAAVAIVVFGYNLPAPVKADQIDGAYKMLTQVVTVGTRETPSVDIRQLKIYTPTHMIYANISLNGKDTSSSFGFGSYTIAGDKLTEKIIYVAADSADRDSVVTFNLLITKTSNGYKQVIPEMGDSAGQKIQLTETYEKVSSGAKDPMDGAWKLVTRSITRDNKTTDATSNQYKVYYGGHFIWGSSYKDTSGKISTGIGFGTFKKIGNNKIEETVNTSTFGDIVGQKIMLDIVMNGNDKFQQTISMNGEKQLETYERVR